MNLLTPWIMSGEQAREQALSPLDTYESYNSTTNISGVLPTRQASKFLVPLMTAFVHSTVHSVWATFSTRTGILVGAVPSGSSNPDPISDQKMLFSTPFSDLAFRNKLYYHYSD